MREAYRTYPKTPKTGDRVKVTAYGKVTYIDHVERTAVVMTEGYTQQALVLPLYMLALVPAASAGLRVPENTRRASDSTVPLED